MLRSGRAGSVSAARQAGQAKPAQRLRRTAKMCRTTTIKRPELFAVAIATKENGSGRRIPIKFSEGEFARNLGFIKQGMKQIVQTPTVGTVD